MNRMITSSKRNIFRVNGHLCGELIGSQGFPRTKASDAEHWCFFDLRLNKRLSIQLWGWWFETLSHPLLRHCNGIEIISWCPGFPWYSKIHIKNTHPPLWHYLRCDRKLTCNTDIYRYVYNNQNNIPCAIIKKVFTPHHPHHCHQYHRIFFCNGDCQKHDEYLYHKTVWL